MLITSHCLQKCESRFSQPSSVQEKGSVTEIGQPPTLKMRAGEAATWEYPPPAAPPLIPKVGPWDGCRTHVSTRVSRCAPRAWLSPTVVVDLPSPSGVGVMPATTTAAQAKIDFLP